jgi:hypothetical protein
MAIEAPLSRFKRNNFIIYIVVCIALGLWFAYDGYLNKSFIAAHTTEQGPDSTLAFNRQAPPVLAVGALLLVGYWHVIRKRKLVAAEDSLHFSNGRKIPYAAIEQIDKTYFDAKGFFTITYKAPDGKPVQHRLSDRQYDNLAPILDHLIAQIS